MINIDIRPQNENIILIFITLINIDKRCSEIKINYYMYTIILFCVNFDEIFKKIVGTLIFVTLNKTKQNNSFLNLKVLWNWY